MSAILPAIQPGIIDPAPQGNHQISAALGISGSPIWFMGTTDSIGLSMLSKTGNHDVKQVAGNSALFDGSMYGTVVGLLSTDVITAASPDVPTCTTNGRLDGLAGETPWLVTVTRAGVVWAIWNMMGTGTQTVEYDASGNGNHLTWQSVTGSAYTTHTDGSGFDLNVLGWTVADGSTIYYDDQATTLIPVGYRIPPGAGYLVNGDPVPTTYPGPIASDWLVDESACLQGDGTMLVVTENLVTLSGDFKLSWSTVYRDTGVDEVIFNGSSPADGYVWINSDSTNAVVMFINSIAHIFTTALVDATKYDISIRRIGAVLTCSVNGSTESVACQTSDVVLSGFSRVGKGLDSAVWALKVINALGATIHHYPCLDGHPTKHTSVATLQDIVGGNDGTIQSITSTAWGLTTERTQLDMLMYGYSVDLRGEERVINGSFDDGIVGWAASDAGTLLEWDELTKSLKVENGDSTAAGACTLIDVVIGETFRIAFDSSQGSGAANPNCYLYLGTNCNQTNILIQPFTGNGTHIIDWVATVTGTINLMVKNSSTSATLFLLFDNVAVRRVYPGITIGDPANPGYHLDGTTPTDHQPDAYLAARNAPVTWEFPLGPPSQEFATEFGASTIDLDAEDYNVSALDKLFVGNDTTGKVIVHYSKAQDANNQSKIEKITGGS